MSQQSVAYACKGEPKTRKTVHLCNRATPGTPPQALRQWSCPHATAKVNPKRGKRFTFAKGQYLGLRYRRCSSGTDRVSLGCQLSGSILQKPLSLRSKFRYDIMIQLISKPARILYSIVVSVIIILFWRNIGMVTAITGLPAASFLNQSMRALLLVIVAFILLAVVMKPKEIFSFLGLNGNILKGFGIALICVLPLYLVFPFFGNFNTELTFQVFYNKCILTGFKEELVFRAFMFGLLFRYAKTGFFWAVILPALYFGSVHLYQGHDVLSALAAFGVTFIGALYFSWMYVEWNFNIWVPVGLHMLMNGAWHVFTMEGTEVAAGGLISNIVRVVSIALAVGLTVYVRRKKGGKVFDYPVWKF